MKIFSPAAIQALIEALTNIYWKRKDIRSFIYHTIDNKSIVATIDWENNLKNESISVLIDRMINREDLYKNDLLKLFNAVMHFNDFSHLKYFEDPDSKIERAKTSVEALRKHAKGYFALKEEAERAEERKKAFESMMKEKLTFQQKIGELRNDFFLITSENDHQKRGYLLEKFLNDLFYIFDLDPKESFKIIGEQIDGAFTFDHQDYLLEAKWQKEPINAGVLYEFGGKISGKLKIALGLFISINGFSSQSLKVDSPVIKSMILMDGSDLMAVLDNRIDLKEMLYRKRRHAVEKGEIFLPFSRF